MHQGVLWRDPSLSHVCVKRRVLKKGPCSSHEILRSSLVQKGFVACLGPPFLLYPASSPALGKRRKSLESFLKLWTGYLASGVEGIAAVLIAFAAIQAALRAIVLFIKRGQGSVQSQEPQTEQLRLRLGRWLALALEFELGADILRTAIAPTWNEIGQLARLQGATGAVTGLSFKLAGTLLKTIQLHTWQQIFMFIAIFTLRTLLKRVFIWEQERLQQEQGELQRQERKA